MSEPSPTAGRPAASSWWARAASLVLTAVVGVFAVSEAIAHPWLLAFVAAAFGLPFLGPRLPRVRRAARVVWRGYLRLTLWLVIAFLPLAAVRASADLVTDVPLLVAVGVLGLWLAVYLFLVHLLWSEVSRRKLWLTLRRVDRVTPFMYAFVLASVAIILFATLAFILSDRDVIHFGTGAAAAAPIAGPADALDFFLWHMLDAIPGLDVTKTLRWEEPLGYSDAGVGLLVLSFKILVIVPIVAAFASFWRYGREPAQSAAAV